MDEHGTTDEDIAAAYVDMPLIENEADVIRWYAAHFNTIRFALETAIRPSDATSRGSRFP